MKRLVIFKIIILVFFTSQILHEKFLNRPGPESRSSFMDGVNLSSIVQFIEEDWDVQRMLHK